MRNYYIFIIILGIFILGLLIEGFIVAGSPYAQKALAEDQKRVSDFASIQSSITSYGYSHNKALPVSLSVLKQQNSYLSITDPVTKKSYDYKVISPTNYQLCTTFSTDSKDNPDSSSYPTYYVANSSNIHKKGYDCLAYTVAQIQSMPQSSYTTPTPIHANCDDYERYGSVLYNSSTSMTVDFEIKDHGQSITVPKNYAGVTIIGEPFAIRDRVLVTSKNCNTTITKEKLNTGQIPTTAQ